MIKRIITVLILLIGVLNINAQSIELDNVKIKNKLSFELVTPTPQNNGRFPEKVGDVFVSGEDTTLTIFRGNKRGYEKVATTNQISTNAGDTAHKVLVQARIDMSDTVANMKEGVFNALDYGAVSSDNKNDTAGINSAIRTAASQTDGIWGNEGEVWIPAGIYYIDGGIKMLDRVTVRCSKNTTFYVSSGYTGSAIIFPEGSSQSDFLFEGGYFIEGEPRLRKWTGIQIIKSDETHAVFGEIRDVKFHFPGYGVRMIMSNSSWANEIEFNRVRFEDFKYGVLIQDAGTGAPQIMGNKFISCVFQAGDSTVYGVSLNEYYNYFIGCQFWDFNLSEKPNPTPVIDNGKYNEFIGCKEIPEGGSILSEFSNNAQTLKVATGFVTFDQDGTATTIAYLPNGAIVYDIKLMVNENFNDSGTDYINIGFPGYENYWDSNIDVSSGSGTFITLSLATSTPRMIWDNNSVTVTYNGENNDSDAGLATVWIYYTTE